MISLTTGSRCIRAPRAAIFAALGDTVVRGTHRARLPGPVTALEASPAYHQDRTILVGTSVGVCISRDAGLTFQPLAEGMGDDVPVVAAAFSPAYATDRLVYAVELGGRVWRHQDH
ncbi:MAG: hypothetical protein LC797_06160 [Chloroflexi bacterium]|nr:hypothetical protein [Chloroflexota bacterium]